MRRNGLWHSGIGFDDVTHSIPLFTREVMGISRSRISAT
jgi:hypothetical protein